MKMFLRTVLLNLLLCENGVLNLMTGGLDMLITHHFYIVWMIFFPLSTVLTKKKIHTHMLANADKFLGLMKLLLMSIYIYKNESLFPLVTASRGHGLTDFTNSFFKMFFEVQNA